MEKNSPFTIRVPKNQPRAVQPRDVDVIEAHVLKLLGRDRIILGRSIDMCNASCFDDLCAIFDALDRKGCARHFSRHQNDFGEDVAIVCEMDYDDIVYHVSFYMPYAPVLNDIEAVMHDCDGAGLMALFDDMKKIAGDFGWSRKLQPYIWLRMVRDGDVLKRFYQSCLED